MSSSSSSSPAPAADAKRTKNDSSSSFSISISRGLFDIDALTAGYTGPAKIRRLLHIGERMSALSTSSPPSLSISLLQQSSSAFQLAIQSSLSLGNLGLYMDSMSRAKEALKGNFAGGYDEKFVNTTTRALSDRVAKLEQDLMNAKRDSEREPTKRAYLALANAYLDRGEYSNALSKFVEAKDYCSGPDQLSVCIEIIKTSIHLGSLNHVKTQVQRAKSLLSAANTDASLINSILNAASGLYNLKTSSFKAAASNFIATGTEINSSFSAVLQTRETGVYAVLCALASFNRNELKDAIMMNSEFKKVVEQQSVWRQVVVNFYQSNYSAVFTFLDSARESLQFDMWLAPHLHVLYRIIRDRAMMFYFRAYSLVNMNTMAAAFNLDVHTLEKQLATLIADNKLQGRIDSQHKTLHARHSDQRTQTFQEAFALTDRYCNQLQLMLLRITALRSDLVVRQEGNNKSMSSTDAMHMQQVKLMQQ